MEPKEIKKDDDIETLKRSNALAIHLYKLAETDVSIIIKQYEELAELYNIACESLKVDGLLMKTSKLLQTHIKDHIVLFKSQKEQREKMAK